MIVYFVTLCWTPVNGFFMWSFYGEQQCMTRQYRNPQACNIVRERNQQEADRLWNTGSIPNRWLSLSMYVKECGEKKI